MAAVGTAQGALTTTSLARAKVNLTLRVLGRRADGYHELDSLTAFAAIADVVTLDPGGPAEVRVSGPMGPGILGPNILSQTLTLLAERHPELRLGSVGLEKVLPVAAGLGGGSANAAALLRLVRESQPVASGSPGPCIDWPALARDLGADVPVCLAGRTTVMTGTGETLQPLASAPVLNAVLVNPRAPVPPSKTRDVFRALAAAPLSSTCSPAALPPVDEAGFLDFVAAGRNDLTAAAIEVVPAIATVLDAIAATPQCAVARMSGAGPTCFGIYPDADAASRAADTVRAAKPEWWVVATAIG